MKRLIFILCLALAQAALAQEFKPYIPEDEMPDVVQVLPAPPADPSTDFDHDILRYMWGKQQRKDPARLEMAIRDAIWSMDTTLVILGEPFGVEISKDKTPAIYEVLTRGITTIESYIVCNSNLHWILFCKFHYKHSCVFPKEFSFMCRKSKYNTTQYCPC